jgi:hypothetical protein
MLDVEATVDWRSTEIVVTVNNTGSPRPWNRFIATLGRYQSDEYKTST